MTYRGRLATLRSTVPGRTGTVLALACLAMPLSVQAQSVQAQSGETMVDPLQSLAACRDVVEPTARLTCFDREFAAFAQAREDKLIAVVDREEVRETRRALFGLPLPRLRLFDRDGVAEVPETFTGTIKSVSSQRGGRFTIQIDDSVWQTTETGYFQTPPRVGQPATVTKGILGSFRLSVDGKSGLKAVRVR